MSMNFKEQKMTLRAQIESVTPREFDEGSILVDSITEKIMAFQFVQSFYRGDGDTTSKRGNSLTKLGLIVGLKSLIQGLGTSAYTIYQVSKSRHKSNPPNSLGWVYAIPPQYFANLEVLDDLEKFLDSTLSDSGIEPPAKYLLQSGTFKQHKKRLRIEVVAHIGASILALENQNRAETIRGLLQRTWSWLKISISHPLFLLVGPEYIVDLFAIKLRVNQSKDIYITTQSQLLAPALIFKTGMEAKRIMFWYSNNSTQITKRGQEFLDYSYLNQPQISTHYVWTSSWGKTLKEHNREALIETIGPVVFKTLEASFHEPNTRLKPIRKVTIFDVTPKKIVGEDSIYSDEVMKNFLADIILSVNAKHPESSIYLKPKREFSPKDSAKYRDFVLGQVPRIEILPWNSDIVNTIKSSDLVVCIPFSSPALISKHLGTPAIFYAPSPDFNLGGFHEDIPIIQGRNELCQFLEMLKV